MQFFGGRIQQVQVRVTVEASLLSLTGMYFKGLTIVIMILIKTNTLESVIWILNIPNKHIKEFLVFEITLCWGQRNKLDNPQLDIIWKARQTYLLCGQHAFS